mgnify:CR=1 FL=1
MKNYLVTGGAGFIGCHLAEELLKRGHKVYSLDDLSTVNIKNLEPLIKKYPEDFKHISKSIEEAEKTGLLSELIDASDVIFHLAAAVGVDLVIKKPTRTLITNSFRTPPVKALVTAGLPLCIWSISCES